MIKLDLAPADLEIPEGDEEEHKEPDLPPGDASQGLNCPAGMCITGEWISNLLNCPPNINTGNGHSDLPPQ